jgi:hypothetical protein
VGDIQRRTEKLTEGSDRKSSVPNIGETTFMPRYFFTIRGTAGEKDDPHGTILPNDAAALSYAECTIAELQKEEGYGDPGLIMIVRNHTHQIIWSIPFLPAYA